jgi:hypothetical protein
LIPESGIVSVGRDSLLVPDSKDLSAGAVVEGGATVVVGGATVVVGGATVVVCGTAVVVGGTTVVVRGVEVVGTTVVVGMTVVAGLAVVVAGRVLLLLVELQQKMVVQKGSVGSCGTGFCGNKKPKGLVHQFIQSVAEDDPWLLVVDPAAFKLKEGKSKRF